MKQYPKQKKFSKYHKGKFAKYEFKSTKLKFGFLGLKAVESGFLSFKQIESARQSISRKIKRKGKIWIKAFTDIPVTRKSTGTRMGKGKGRLSHWVCRVKAGSVLFEVCGLNYDTIRDGLKTSATKLPIKTKIFR